MSIPAGGRRAADRRAAELREPLRVTDGVWAVPVPLHGSPLRSVTVFLVETSDGLVLIDAGYDHPSCWEPFTRAVAEIGHELAAVRLVLLTHNHPDHIGFADRIRALSGARVVMGRDDDFAHQRDVRGGGFLVQLRATLDRTGAPPDVIEEMYTGALGIARHTEDLRLDLAPERDSEHVVGDVTIRGLHTPGHTHGHAVYVDDARGVVFTGDTMMAEGPTQLAVPSLPGDDPAGDLLASLDRIRDLGAGIACPAHQTPYRDVRRRAEELAAFHRAELDAVARLLRTRESAWEIAPCLTWSKPWDELGTGGKRFALVHTLSLILGVTR
ncbi:MBL fold metallo-hydrolase [Actinomadura sp. WMMB 499]|uniref:MBL fold metallo-hydrolase n=1 Tax=Actinomadura sp. WMMB 499 TaxID=1219491 RepID=UPI001244F817|nr:MBL fold metallo-hydrolase [Actinomadura sp. WMMB 499]QFG24656.1 MBL fold metallo-hydrolase [Actinomadura sp. WMMB 499]